MSSLPPTRMGTELNTIPATVFVKLLGRGICASPDWPVGVTRSQSSTSARREIAAPRLVGSIEMHADDASSSNACSHDTKCWKDQLVIELGAIITQMQRGQPLQRGEPPVSGIMAAVWRH